ncbi:MAG: xanthine dehydrogenase family protein molybdopterin-binding subunit [Thermoleophilia bacterium]|nr:xanthine dehydrogenase family protein molybdopterin-binding subunit [Thermoleophilia bacterium]
MARLIKTEKEVEGHYTETWVVVEEDVLEQWPAGPRAVVGQPAPRIDGHERARGEARYTADLALPGMLHTAVLRSPYARARVRRIDASRALTAPGVRAVLLPEGADLPPQHAPEAIASEPGAIGAALAERARVAPLTSEPGYEGHAVAAVAAETQAQAQAALRLLAVDWEPLEPLLDADDAVRRKSLVSEPRVNERGDLERGLAEADVVVEAVYRTQNVLHNSLETHQAICHWHGDGELDVYISTQFVWGVRDAVAERFGLERDKVRVVCEYMGGGFGSKNGPGEYTLIAAELARRTGRPVRCALDRRDESRAAGNRNATIQRLVAGARADGTLTALGGEFVNAVGWDGLSASTAGPMQLLYACDNVRTVEYGARLNTPPNAAFRAPGFVEGTFGLECLIDELAAKLDLDPLEVRRRNYATTDPVNERDYSAKGLERCYQLAERHWARRDDVRARSDGAWKRGVGLASQIWFGAGGPPSYAWLRLNAEGHATVITAMQDIGTGTRTAVAQIAAEELGFPLARVSVALGDSARGPFASISAGSSTTPSMGPAVRAAAADVKRQLLEIAAQRYAVDISTLTVEDGRIVAGGSRSWPVEEITGLLGDGQLLGKGARGPNPTGMRVLTFGVQVAEVAVDVGTGEVVVERVAAIHDVGRIVNPLGARSQVEGGIVQAIGYALSEARLLDPASGTVLTKTLDAYKLPTIADVPEIVTEFVDEPDPHLTNLGSKGLGEPPIIPTAAAIANAIRDATGADVRSLPVTREEMLRALREARERERDRLGAPAA